MSVLKISVTCPVCGKVFEKSKPAALRSSLCRSCGTKETHKNSPEIMVRALEKRRATCLAKYGVDNVAKDPEIKEREAVTHMERYGVRRPLQRKEIYDKTAKNSHTPEARANRINNSIKKHGATHHMKSPEFLKEYQEKYEARTGYDNPMHNPEIVQKVIDLYGRVGAVKGYWYQDKHFDSSWELALYIWLVDNKKQFIYHPTLSLEYEGDDGKTHLYYPDFLIEGKFYEIKGSQFFNEAWEPFNMYTQKFWWGKLKALEAYNVVILRKEDMKMYLEYVTDTYGQGYLKQFKAPKV